MKTSRRKKLIIAAGVVTLLLFLVGMLDDGWCFLIPSPPPVMVPADLAPGLHFYHMSWLRGTQGYFKDEESVVYFETQRQWLSLPLLIDAHKLIGYYTWLRDQNGITRSSSQGGHSRRPATDSHLDLPTPDNFGKICAKLCETAQHDFPPAYRQDAEALISIAKMVVYHMNEPVFPR